MPDLPTITGGAFERLNSSTKFGELGADRLHVVDADRFVDAGRLTDLATQDCPEVILRPTERAGERRERARLALARVEHVHQLAHRRQGDAGPGCQVGLVMPRSSRRAFNAAATAGQSCVMERSQRSSRRAEPS